MGIREEIRKITFGFGLTFIIWWIFAILLNMNIIPNPIFVFNYLFDNFVTKGFYQDFLVSMYRIAVPITLSLIIGVPVGLYLGQNKSLDRLVSPMVYFFYPIPKIVFLPILFIFFGINEFSRISLIFLIVIFQVIIGARDASRKVGSDYLDLFRSLSCNKKPYLKLILPFSLPEILSSLRISIGVSIAILFVTETFAARQGLGYMILNSMEIRNYLEMYSGIVLLGTLGILCYLLVDLFDNLICFWKN